MAWLTQDTKAFYGPYLGMRRVKRSKIEHGEPIRIAASPDFEEDWYRRYSAPFNLIDLQQCIVNPLNSIYQAQNPQIKLKEATVWPTSRAAHG